MGKWLYHIVAFVVVAVWGSTFVFTKLLLLSGLSAAQIFTLRFIIAYLLLMGFSLTRRSFRLMSHSLRDEMLANRQLVSSTTRFMLCMVYAGVLSI